MVRRGDAAAQVIDYACADAAGMIILGAQHKRFADTTVIGTTTVRVTRHAFCPVLTVVRPAESRGDAVMEDRGSHQPVTVEAVRSGGNR